MRFPPVLLLSLTIATLAHAAGPRVDLNQNVARADILSPHWENWKVPDGPTATATFGEISVVLRAVGPGATLRAAWWKPGLDFPARMASDGVVTTGELELVLRGLTPGRHSLATYHNALTDVHMERIIVQRVGGQPVEVQPTKRIAHDADTASAYLEFEAQSGKDVVVRLRSRGATGVVLNGFEIDRPNPARRARKPTPADHDEHAPEQGLLTWHTAPGATAHHLYVGSDPDAVARATPRSPEFRGDRKGASLAIEELKLDTLRPYFWRVDVVYPDGTVPGETWIFRIRHSAFPEAEGYGRFAQGGRGGKVYEVTNLNDAGPGSLREAVEARGPRTVVFRVGGLIALKSKLVVRHPYLTVAGQTAPGDGICLKNYTFGCSDTHDVIIRHVRIRIGDETGTTQDGSGARGSDHVIYDHCSISWSIDEGFSSREARNLTVQRCLIAEALHLAGHEKYKGTGKGHSFAGSISGNIGSFHHNLLAHCTGRNWSLAGGLDRTGTRLAGRLDLRNNVIYNWRDRTTDGGVLELNFVNNYYLPGPATRVHTLLKPDPGDPERGMRAYMAGNVIDGKPAIDADNWSAAVGPAAGLARIRSHTPLFESYVRTQTARESLDDVLADVGATRPRQDAVDHRILADVRQRRHSFTGSRGQLPGIVDTPADAGGYPAYQSGEPPRDTDHDGMPDDWEQRNGLDPRNPADGAAFRPDGYTHLEYYLNHLASELVKYCGGRPPGLP